MKGYHHVPAGLEYPRGGQPEMDLDPEGQSRGYDLQTVPYHVADILVLSYWKRKLLYPGTKYIVFAFSVIMFLCLSVNFFLSKISRQLLDLGF